MNSIDYEKKVTFNTAMLSANGLIATGASDNTVRIWDAKTRRQVHICRGHKDQVNIVRWSHDNRFLASASSDGTVRVWDAKTGEQVDIYTVGVKTHILRWSHDNRFLASAGDDNKLHMWNPKDKDGEYVRICTGHEAKVNEVIWSYDQYFLASASDNGTVRIWDAMTGKQLHVCTGHEAKVNTVSWSCYQLFLASGSDDGTVRIWDTKTGQELKVCKKVCKADIDGQDTYHSVAWWQNNVLVSATNQNRMVSIWNVKDGTTVVESISIGELTSVNMPVS